MATGKRKLTRETCTARVPAPHSQSVWVDISRGNTTYAIGAARVHRAQARLRLRILRTIPHARYVVSVIATSGQHATVTRYSATL